MSKKIWARIGMELEVSDEEYEKIKAEVLGGRDPIDDELAERFWRDGIQNGDSYIPMEIFERDIYE